MKPVCVISIVMLLAAVYFCVASGCTGYGEVSDRTYELAKALYSICNAQDDQRLSNIKTMIANEKQGAAITAKEIGWLEDIVNKAESGHWESAAAMARRLMEDQVSPIGG